jgi:cardiolipin synthase
MRDLLVAALARARSRVQLATPYFLPGTRLRAALCAAADRGVRVELLIAGLSDHPVVRWASHALLPELLDRGVLVYEFEHAMMHAKLAVFDDSWAILGTSNLDRQSLRRSYEVNLIVAGGALPGNLSNLVESDLQASRPLTAQDLLTRSWPERLRDRLARFVLTRV